MKELFEKVRVTIGADEGVSAAAQHACYEARAALDSIEEQYEIQAARIEQLSEQLVRRTGERDEAEEQLKTYRVALERIAWSVGPDEYEWDALLPQVQIARTALNPASES